ncbi:hypothetical protein GASC598I20_000810, partial [Gilliamella apicola SCGC AB-598-I20]
ITTESWKTGKWYCGGGADTMAPTTKNSSAVTIIFTGTLSRAGGGKRAVKM